MQLCVDIPGVLPIFDSDISEKEGRAWIAMGLAQPIRDALGAGLLRQVIEAVRDIAHTLQIMHAREISHRDIKPENLFRFDERWCVGDLGLAHFEGKLSETQSGERLGPLLFIAPEMLNQAIDSDGAPADVFSLAKTMWVLATGLQFPLPGPYERDRSPYRLASYVQEARTASLDSLIATATSLDPSARPSMAHFRAELDAWLTQPVATEPAAMRLDLADYALEIQRRAEEFEHSQREQTRLQEERNAVGLRLRERLRPLAKAMEAALRGAHLLSVSLNIDNYFHGFEIQAMIPGVSDLHTRLLFTLWIQLDQLPITKVACVFKLERIGDGQMLSRQVYWETERTFLDGGSEEEWQLNQLRSDLETELQHATHAAAAMSMKARQLESRSNSSYVVWVFDAQGKPV